MNFLMNNEIKKNLNPLILKKYLLDGIKKNLTKKL